MTALRLFDPTCASAVKLDESATLRELFQLAFDPLWITARQLSPKTKTAYLESLTWWEALTDNPPLAAIDDFALAEFVEQLARQPGRRTPRLSSYTIKRHCRHLQRLLDFAGPRTRTASGRKNLGLLADPPLIEGPRPDRQPPAGDWTIQQLHALYRVAEAASRPNHGGIAPPAWWRAVLVVGYYTGLRRNALLSLQFADLEACSEGARIVVPAGVSKGRRGTRVFLPPLALEHIERIRGERARILDWPGFPGSHLRTLTKHFSKWLRAAGLSDRGPKFHGLRKTHLTQLAALGMDAGQRLAQQSAGHADRATTTNHYINSQAADAALMRAVLALPSPVPADADQRQLRLF